VFGHWVGKLTAAFSAAMALASHAAMDGSGTAGVEAAVLIAASLMAAGSFAPKIDQERVVGPTARAGTSAPTARRMVKDFTCHAPFHQALRLMVMRTIAYRPPTAARARLSG
jgi:hypothetical protein